MKINILAIGKLKPSDPQHLIISEYVKRLNWDLKIQEFQDIKTGNILESKNKEADLLLSKAEKSSILIALDERGKEFNSKEFATLIEKHSKVSFLIGGAFGHGDNILNNKDIIKISLSKMTLPHMIARLLLIEQIYRSYTIINNHPYHKD